MSARWFIKAPPAQSAVGGTGARHLLACGPRQKQAGVDANSPGVAPNDRLPLAGLDSGGYWSRGYIGHYSAAFNRDTVASRSAAFGSSTQADGRDAFAAGRETWADGLRSFVLGYQSEAHGQDNIVLGARVRSLVNGAFVFGDNSTLTTGQVTFAQVPNSFTARVAGGVYFYTNSAHTSGVKLDGGGS